MRSRRQPSVLTFLAQDAEGQAFCYSNADLRKGEEAEEVFRFIAFWKRAHGKLPRELVFDSRLTTQPNLVRLDDMGIDFITLRRRSPQMLEQVAALPASAWRRVELDVPTRRYRTPRVHEQAVTISGRTFRQLFIDDLGHDKPTVLLTNQRRRRPSRRLLIFGWRQPVSDGWVAQEGRGTQRGPNCYPGPRYLRRTRAPSRQTA
jgi:hypothetical protein